MQRYIRLYKRFLSQAFSYESQYRASTFMNVLTNLFWLVMMVVALEIIFANTDVVAGWSKEEMLILALFWGVIDEFGSMIWKGSHHAFSDMVVSGDLDGLLTKPINTFFFVNFRLFLMRSLYRFVVTLILFVVALFAFDLTITLTSFLLMLLTIGSALIAYFSFSLILNTFSFWFGRIENINSLVDAVLGATRYPLDVFSKPIRIFLLTVVPIGLMSYTPIVTLLQKSSTLLVLLSWIIAGIFLAASTLFFRFALRRYTSASS